MKEKIIFHSTVNETVKEHIQKLKDTLGRRSSPTARVLFQPGGNSKVGGIVPSVTKNSTLSAIVAKALEV